MIKILLNFKRWFKSKYINFFQEYSQDNFPISDLLKYIIDDYIIYSGFNCNLNPYIKSE